jgi:hypothetical protein
MRLNPKKIVFNQKISLSEAINVYKILLEVIEEWDESLYYYVYIKKDFDIFIETIHQDEVYWLASKLSVDDRDAVVCLMEFPSFWEDLKDHLYNCSINDYKRYSVFTKSDLMGSEDRTWEEYLGDNEEDAYIFFNSVLMIEDIVSIIELDDEA